MTLNQTNIITVNRELSKFRHSGYACPNFQSTNQALQFLISDHIAAVLAKY
jgi:hypothetical protein